MISWYPSHLILSCESTSNSGSTFTNSYPDWQEGTCNNFQKWAAKQFGLRNLGSDNEEEVPIDMQKAKNLEFLKNKRGDLILPPIEYFKTIRQRQRVIRGYIDAIYHKSIESKGLFSSFFKKN